MGIEALKYISYPAQACLQILLIWQFLIFGGSSGSISKIVTSSPYDLHSYH